MNKKNLTLFLIFIHILSTLFNPTWSNSQDFKGHVQKNEDKTQEALFNKEVEKLNKNQILNMTVSKVLDSSSSKKGDEFFAEVTNEVISNNGVLIPCGSIAHGKISQVKVSRNLGKNGVLDLDFDYLITPDGREIPIEGKMSTRLHPIIESSKNIATDLAYTAAGGAAGGLLALSWLGLNGAIASQGSTVAIGGAIGGSVGLGIALYRKGKDVLISPGDEIAVKINTKEPLVPYKKSAFYQHEFSQEGIDIKINNISYEKDPFGEVNTIILSTSIKNDTNSVFSIYDLSLTNNFNVKFYPAMFGDESQLKKIKPKDKVELKIPFCVDNIKDKFYLTLYSDKKLIAKISLSNAYKNISAQSKEHNLRIYKKKTDFCKESLPFNLN